MSKRITKRILKVVIILSIILAIVFTVLSNLGGNSDGYKDSLETLVSENFPDYEARVGTLNQVSFFPYIGVDVEDVEIVHSSSQQLIAATDKAQVAMGFWDAAFGSGKISSLHVQGLGANVEYINAQTVLIEYAAILTRGNEAFFEAKGRLGGNDFLLNLPMQHSGEGHKKRFEFPAERTFALNAGDISIRGVLLRDSENVMLINNAEISNDELTLRGDLQVDLEGDFQIRGDMLNSNAKPVSLEITIPDSKNVFGAIRFESEADKAAYSKIFGSLVEFWFGQPLSEFPRLELEVQ